MKLMTQPGDTLTEGFGPDLATPTLLVTMTLHHDGIAFQVSNGASPISELCKTFTNWEHAAGYYRLLRDTANAGKRIYQIVAEAAALVEMMGIDTARTEDEIREALNADINAHTAEVVVPTHNAVVATVAEVMSGTKASGGWYGARKAAQQTAAPARMVHPTRTRVHCKPPTAAELDLIRNHHGGVVTTRPGQPWTVLRAMWRRGLGEPTYRPGTRIIASLQLNARGLTLADVEVAAA